MDRLEECDRELASVMPDVKRISEEIVALPIPPNQKLGMSVIVATHFIRTAAALMAGIVKAKGGPELDLAGWSEEIMKMVLARAKSERH